MGNKPIYESNRTYSNPSQIDIEDILKPEDIEDQFLRLKEVFNCDIECVYDPHFYGSEYNIVIIMDMETWNLEKFEKIKEEISRAKYRLKSMYHIHIVDHQSGMPCWKMTILLPVKN